MKNIGKDSIYWTDTQPRVVSLALESDLFSISMRHTTEGFNQDHVFYLPLTPSDATR